MNGLLNLPIPPAAEDRPEWYAILARVATGIAVDAVSVRIAAQAAIAHHDQASAELAKLGIYLADAANATLRHAAEHEECPPLCDW